VGLAEGFDEEVFLTGDLNGEIAKSNGFPERMPIANTRGRTHNFPAVENGLAAMQRRKAIDGEGAELSRQAGGFDFCQRLATDEITLVKGDTESQPRFVRVLVR
jgi:hypothetical protein